MGLKALADWEITLIEMIIKESNREISLHLKHISKRFLLFGFVSNLYSHSNNILRVPLFKEYYDFNLEKYLIGFY